MPSRPTEERRPDPERVLLAGDTHGNIRWVAMLAVLARHYECDAMVQLGDFGYWPHTERGRLFLERTEKVTAHVGIPLYWLDGNHENHDLLQPLSGLSRFGGSSVTSGGSVTSDDSATSDDSDLDPFVAISPHVHWIPRGARWHWHGWAIGALGGAFSIDWRLREGGVNWWTGETTTAADVAQLGDAPLDLLFTHDVPIGIGVRADMPLPADDLARARHNRTLVQEAFDATGPELLVHGHWHVRHSLELARSVSLRPPGDPVPGPARVEGFASDLEGDERAWGVLDVRSLELIPVEPPAPG